MARGAVKGEEAEGEGEEVAVATEVSEVAENTENSTTSPELSEEEATSEEA